MNVVFLMEAGIPSYRNFLFNYLNNQPEISSLLVIHTGKIYDSKDGKYFDKKVKFIGSNKLGFHVGIFKYLRNADVIISSYNLRILTCWLPCFFFRSKWIFWGKGLGENDHSIINFIRQETAKNCRFILVYNNKKKEEFLSKINISPSKIVAYKNTIEIKKPINYSTNNKEYFLYFGRIQKRKGLMELIKSYKIYLENVISPKFKLRIVGDGDYKPELIKFVEENSLGSFVEFFPGVYSEIDIEGHFKNAILYTSPFNVGLAVINSFAYGVPVLTCSSPQVGPEYYYLNNSNAIIVDDIKDFSKIFIKYESENLVDGNKVFSFYLENLDSKIMEENFFNTILKMK